MIYYSKSARKKEKELIELLGTEDFNFLTQEEELDQGIFQIPPNGMVLLLTSEDFQGDGRRKKTKTKILNFQNIIIIQGFVRFKEETRIYITQLFLSLLNLSSTQQLNHLGFIPSRNMQDSALIIKSIAHREQVEDKPPDQGRNKPKKKYLYQAQEFFIEGLLNVGPKKVKLLLKEFKTPKAVIDAIINHPELIEGLHGFGPQFIENNQTLIKLVKSTF